MFQSTKQQSTIFTKELFHGSGSTNEQGNHNRVINTTTCSNDLSKQQQEYGRSIDTVESLKVINKGLDDNDNITIYDPPDLRNEAADTSLLQDSVERYHQRRFDIISHAPMEIASHIFDYLMDLLLLHNDDDNNMLLSSILNVSKAWRAKVLGCANIWTDINTKSFKSTISNSKNNNNKTGNRNQHQHQQQNRNLYLFRNIMPIVGIFIKTMELHVDPDNKLYHDFVKCVRKGVFDNLQVLIVHSPRMDVWNLQRSNVNSMLGVLQRIGSQLIELKFNSDNNGNNILPCIFTVLSLCPNLKKLSIRTIRILSNIVSSSNTLSSIPKTTLHQINRNCSTPSSPSMLTSTTASPIIQQQQQQQHHHHHHNQTAVQLEKLCLYTDHIENNALERILRHCTELHHLYVFGQLQDQEDLSRMLQHYCSKLRLFNFNSAIEYMDNKKNDNDNNQKQQYDSFSSLARVGINTMNNNNNSNDNNNKQLMTEKEKQERIRGLRHLYLSDDTISIEAKLLLLSDYCNTLETLHLIIMAIREDQQGLLEDIKRLCFPSLRKLFIHVQRNTHDTTAHIIRHCPMLQDLTVNIRHAELAYPTLSAITANDLPYLEHLDIRGRTNMEDISDQLTVVFESYYPYGGFLCQQQDIYLSSSSSSLSSLLRQVSLTELNVPNESNVLTTLAGLPSIRCIRLSGMIISMEMMNKFVNELKEQSSLEELCIQNLPKDPVTNDTIDILCSIPTLKTLKLQRVLKITDECLNYFVNAIPRLQYLVIQQCHLITQETIDQVKKKGIRRIDYVPLNGPRMK